MTDWVKIRSEYISGNISYRKLAEKYDVGISALTKRARNENWFDKRLAQRSKIEEKVTQKAAEKLAEREAERLIRISDAADKLLEKIETAMEQLDQFIVTNKVKQREVQYVDVKAGYGKPKKEVVKELEDKRIVKADHLDRNGLKQLTSALKDLRDIQFAREEEKEQESPEINIMITAATPEDALSDDESGDDE